MEHPRCFRAVQGLLRSCYAEVLPLEAFVQRLQEGVQVGGQLEALVQNGDPKCYRSLVGRCVVGLPAECKAPPQLTFQQVSSQNDVVARVIQRICEKKKKKNVLAFGYTLLDENKHQVPSMPNICSCLPNNTTEIVRQNVLWEIVLSRVGDDVMMYVLEHCALFMLVPPSCCYQICGQPVYELTSSNVVPSVKFLRQSYSRRSRGVLSSYLQRRFPSHRKYLAKAKRNSRRPRRNRTQDSDGPPSSLMVRRATAQDPTRNKPVTRSSDYAENLQRDGQGPSLTRPLLKRKWRSRYEIAPKRMKIMQVEEALEEETKNTGPTQSKNQLILDVDGGSASGRPVRSYSVAGLNPTKSVPQRSDHGPQISAIPYTALDNQKFAVCGKTFKLGSEDKTLGGSSTKTKFNTWLPKLEMGNSNVKSVQMAAAERSLKTYTSKSIWESSDKISTPVPIKRHTFLYSHRQLKERLPKSFVLNHLKGYLAGGRRLIETIFFGSKIPKQPTRPNPPSCNWRKKRLPKRYWQMRNVFQELLHNHIKCPYLVLLKKNCPIWISESDKTSTVGQRCKPTGLQERSFSRTPGANSVEECLRSIPGGFGQFLEDSSISGKISEKAELSLKETKQQTHKDSSSSRLMVLLKQHSSHWQVYTFVRECLERVVPSALWGSNRNKCRFYKNVKKFISLGKFATFSLQELMWKMRVSDCTWLRLTKEDGHFVPASEHRFREDLMSKFLYWLMDTYVADLLRSFFYITETMFQKNLLFFFRKSVWNELQKIGVRNHLTKVHLRVLLKEEIEILQKKKCVPLASKLRFIPKQNGLRPVVKLNSVSLYFNIQLKNLFSVLNYERIKNPTLLGSSVFGKDEMYAMWKQFVLKVLETHAEMPRFYFVKADVSGAYDTIPHNKLVEVILRVLAPNKKTSYNIRRYAVVMKTRNGYTRRYYRRHVSTDKAFIPDMKEFVFHLQETTSLRNAVIVEQSVYLKETSSSLCEFFLQLIRNSILKIENRYYVQCCGIPQGSILSTLLCNLCYGDMENKLLCGVQEDGMLMRLTDDFLLVTPHLMQAKTFLRTLAMGIPEYGFVINPAKTVVNFPVDEAIPGCSEFKQLPTHTVIPWCGLLIDTQTLEVYCDYTNYACTSIRSSLSFNSSVKAGVSMRNKLLAVLQLKCHSLFLDLQINSLRTVCINVYKILLLQAYRFHACVLQLPFNQQIKNNPSFFLRIISDTASCCFCILKAKNAEIAFSPAGTSTQFTYEVTQWLCYHAFSIKMTNHRVIYKYLLTPLKQCKIQLLRKIPEATMQLLKQVTAPSLYEDFKVILD
ncbi:telomerase reverse transcriptase isoform X2 [Hemicordylus capensis]|uniref:telomerase reverse transcriptase isoform X2 n=1 Tax=Hemicordylus capensis TaxID=884348 RepID=UPI002304464F|nr:telomerase reverse transcriptase isoform X2 [Hemicordylus capensis]